MHLMHLSWCIGLNVSALITESQLDIPMIPYPTRGCDCNALHWHVYSCFEVCGHAAGTHFACKTIPKIPKRGKGTPRYLLKLQTEVDAMVQLGPSLDAVYLKVGAAQALFSMLSAAVAHALLPWDVMSLRSTCHKQHMRPAASSCFCRPKSLHQRLQISSNGLR